MLSPLLLLVALAGFARADKGPDSASGSGSSSGSGSGKGKPTPGDPCTSASASTWVSSAIAHACELNVPYNKTRSLAVVDSTIKALQYYSLENWFLHSPNPLIPHDVNVRSLLEGESRISFGWCLADFQPTDVQKTANTGKYKTDWEFNMAVSAF